MPTSDAPSLSLQRVHAVRYHAQLMAQVLLLGPRNKDCAQHPAASSQPAAAQTRQNGLHGLLSGTLTSQALGRSDVLACSSTGYPTSFRLLYSLWRHTYGLCGSDALC